MQGRKAALPPCAAVSSLRNLPPTFQTRIKTLSRRNTHGRRRQVEFKIKTPMGEQSGVLELKADGAALTGSMSGIWALFRSKTARSPATP